MRKRERLKCLADIADNSGKCLFKKDSVYEVLYVENESAGVKICIDGREFGIEWVLKNFKKIK